MKVPVAASARRLTQYGYGWVIDALLTVYRFIRTGSIAPDNIRQPFGEYDERAEGRVGRRSKMAP